MKKLNITLVSIIAAASLLMVGCKTPSQTQTAQLAVTSAVQLGTVAYLSKNPKAEPDFAASEILLSDISTNNNIIDVSSVDEALASAGKTNSPVVNLVISDAVSIGNLYIQNNAGTNALQKSQSVKLVCGWISTGINEGILLYQVP